ncbi:MAG TPA: type II secretion system F family protein [Nitrospiria bacterium]|nr:type II secretion system F family protein [Nitrospiria bacterium]
MPTFNYRVARTDGTILESRVQAEDEEGLRRRLEGEGYLILSLSMAKGVLPSVQNFSFGRYSGREFLIFNQEFLVLLKAGLPVVKIFEILEERSGQPGFGQALGRIRQEVKNGSAISDAMINERRYFPELYTSSLRAGEKSGNLIEIIGRYIEYQKKILAVRKKVVSALAYPSFLLIIGLGVMLFLLIYVMPSFSEIYQDSKAELPALTRTMLAIVTFSRAHLLTLFGLLILLGVGARLLYMQRWGRKVYDWLILKTPFLRSITLKHYIIRMTRTLGSVLKSGIPLVPALQMTADAMANGVVATKVQSATERVKEGVSLSNAFGEMGIMPKMALEMISVGESTGALEEMLMQVADFHEDELDLYLSRVTTWVEPVLLLLMGGIVAIILIAMYLPIFHLAGTIQ